MIVLLERDLLLGLIDAASTSHVCCPPIESTDEVRTGGFRKEFLRSEDEIAGDSRAKDEILAVTLSKKLPFE
jgi:hypothetical protein